MIGTPSERTDRHDQYGRPWGHQLWPDGPVLGGTNWRTWVAQSQAVEAERRRIADEAEYVDRSPAAYTRRRAALKYAFATIGSGTSPLVMVEAILAGERDDIVRTIL